MKMPKKLKDHKLALSGFYFGAEPMSFKYLVDHFESCISGDLTEELIEDPAIGTEEALERVKCRYNPTVYAVYEVVGYDMRPTKAFINRCAAEAAEAEEALSEMVTEENEESLKFYAELYARYKGVDPQELL